MAGFKSAFAAARKAGKKEFTWNGKSYNTKLKGEGASKKSSLPSSTNAVPKSRDSAVSSKSTSRPSFSGMAAVSNKTVDKVPTGSRSRGGGPVFKGTVGPAKRKNPDTSMTPRRTKADLDIGSQKPLKDSALFNAGRKLLRKRYQ